MNDIKQLRSSSTKWEIKKGKFETISKMDNVINGVNNTEVETLNNLNQIYLIDAENRDPFVGYLSTPITSSKIIETYLSYLPAYRTNLSPLLKGISIGFAHGYILLGPFAKLGPLRDTLASNFVGFLSAISLIILLTAGLTIYGSTVYWQVSKKKTSESYLPRNHHQNFEGVNFFNLLGWRELSSGFILGGFGGSGIAYAILTLLN